MVVTEEKCVYAIPGIREVSTPESILNQVCELYGEDPSHVMSLNGFRGRPYVEIRQVVMTIMWYKTKRSRASIAAFFGIDHATASHAHKTIRNIFNTDKRFRQFFIDNFGINPNDERC